LVFLLEFPVEAAFLVQLAVEFLDNVLVMAFGSRDGLIGFPNHLWRQALQIRASLPVKTDKLLVQFRESRHGTSPVVGVGASAN
jgi:hypothetical protein